MLNAYAELELDGIIYAVKGKGHFIGKVTTLKTSSIEIDWKQRLNETTLLADEIDLIRQDIHWKKGMISFTSIAPPEEKLFDVENFKRAFLTRMSIEGDIVLNYGYARDISL